jgi:hypothetical protein
MSDDASLPVARRRRWPRIVALLLILAAIAGGTYWLVKPKTVTATTLFEVRRIVPSLTANQADVSGTDQDFEILKKTQIATLKAKFLLTSALRNPGIASLSLFAGVRDPEEWLQEHLDVSFPENGEILAISLSGPESQAHELALVVDAVAEAYKREVLGGETDRKLKLHDMVERSLQNLNAEIKRKSEDFIDIAKGMGRALGDNDPEMQFHMKRMDRIDEELAQLEREQLRIATGGDSKDSKFVDARIDQLRKRQDELLKTIQRRNERSADLESRGEELKQLQTIANDMCFKLEQLDIDRQLPARIRQLQPAVIDDGKIARQ